VPGHVCCRDFRLLAPHRSCTTDVLRCTRRNDECRDNAGWSLPPRNVFVPSYHRDNYSRAQNAADMHDATILAQVRGRNLDEKERGFEMDRDDVIEDCL
jgi:hypothetical protein